MEVEVEIEVEVEVEVEVAIYGAESIRSDKDACSVSSGCGGEFRAYLSIRSSS